MLRACLPDEVDELVRAVAVATAELHELSGLGEDGPALGGTGDVDTAPAPEIQQTLVTQQPERSQDSVGVDLEHGGEVPGGGESLSRRRLALGDGAAYLARDLFMQDHGSVPVDLDIQHGASDTSVMFAASGRSWTPPRWAVVKDARRRQRHRRRRMLATVVAMLLAAVIGWLIAGASRSRLQATSPTVVAGTGDPLHLGGVVVDTTTLRGEVWVLTCLRRCSGSPSTASEGELIKLAADGRPVNRFAVPDPTALTGGDDAIWVTHSATDEVTRINPQTGATTATIRLALPTPFTTSGDRRFVPSGISFGAGHVWVSTWKGWTAGIDAHTDRVGRMAWSSSQVTSATTAAGLTWIADELDGVGTFAATSDHVVVQPIRWAGQPVDIATVAQGAGRIWALGSVAVPTLTNLNRNLDIVTTIDPRTRRIIHQWNIAGADSIAFANGTPYIGELGSAQVVRLTGRRTPQVLHLRRRIDALAAGTPHVLWATTHNGQLLGIDLSTRSPRVGTQH